MYLGRSQSRRVLFRHRETLSILSGKRMSAASFLKCTVTIELVIESIEREKVDEATIR